MADGDTIFRQEAGRMVAALTRVFGLRNLALAEDVVQEAFCRAMEVWSFRGTPENPAAWLMASAKNCARDALRRDKTARNSASEFGRFLESEWTLAPTLDELFSPEAIKDDLLRMMFSCCHPRLPEEAQIGLILNILCGFGVDETASAFMSGRAAVEKRLQRAKKTLAGTKKMFEFGGEREFAARLPSVQRALYLMFNEGYHGAWSQSPMRAQLCSEALRLASLLADHLYGATPETFALCALMALHAARLTSRSDAGGELVAMADQDRRLWNRKLISSGMRHLELSATGGVLSVYHVEAAIASIHALAPSAEETDWRAIVALYDSLMAINPTPVAALSRAVALAQVEGPERGLAEIAAIEDSVRLKDYPFHAAALGELELRAGRCERAREWFRAALDLARSPAERRFYERRLLAAKNDGEAEARRGET